MQLEYEALRGFGIEGYIERRSESVNAPDVDSQEIHAN